MKIIKKLLFIFSPLFMVFSCSNNQQSHVHSFTDTIVDATCEDRGYICHICDSCGYEYHDTFTEPLGHAFTTFVMETGNLEADEGEIIHQCIRCEQRQSTPNHHINVKEKGVTSFRLFNSNVACRGYDSESLILSISNFSSLSQITLYYTFDADYGLFYDQSFRVIFNSDQTYDVFGYNSGDYTLPAQGRFNHSYSVGTDTLYFIFNYASYGLTYQSAYENFAFYISLSAQGNTYEYRQLNPYVVSTFSETWIKVNGNGRFYYPTKYQDHKCENWERPDITRADTNWTYCCRAETPEEAIASMLIAQEKGATNVDVNLLYLKPVYRNLNDFEKIFKSFKDIATIAVYYNSDVSQQERMNTLKLAVQAGAGGIDLQGFMFHEGSTLDTQTDANVQYWENLGYDMSFVHASPKETTIDPTEDAQQMQFIEEIHQMGGKVLGSQHTQAQFTRRQAVAYGEWLNHRGLDIIKIVSYAKNRMAFEDTVLANKDAYYDEKITAKYSIHTNNSSTSDLSRVIGPLFYHTYMVFHYTYLCHLQMMMELLNNPNITFDDSIGVDEAIGRINGNTKDPELGYLISEYTKLNNDYLYALGSGSDMSDRWSVSGNNTSIALRNATGTNSFSIRGGAVLGNWNSNNFEFETTISGYFKPYTSSARLPKFGIYIGDQDHMLALTYNFKTSSGVGSSYSISVFTNSYYFGYDTKTKDALDTEVVSKVDISNNVVNGDVVRLKISYNNGNISFYYSVVASGEYTLLASLEYDAIKDYFTHASDKSTWFGNVEEVYLGSASVGAENYANFANLVTKH